MSQNNLIDSTPTCVAGTAHLTMMLGIARSSHNSSVSHNYKRTDKSKDKEIFRNNRTIVNVPHIDLQGSLGL